jgi:hypothetical protein
VVTLKSKDGQVVDTVKSYFGMRSVGKQLDPKGFTRLLLNGKPVILAGALDQGFWRLSSTLCPANGAEGQPAAPSAVLNPKAKVVMVEDFESYD